MEPLVLIKDCIRDVIRIERMRESQCTYIELNVEINWIQERLILEIAEGLKKNTALPHIYTIGVQVISDLHYLNDCLFKHDDKRASKCVDRIIRFLVTYKY